MTLVTKQERDLVRPHRPGQIGLMGHVIADFPDPKACRAMIASMVAAGVEIIEIQLPHSEPMADGPVFLAANHQALRQGVSYADAMALLAEMHAAYPQVRFLIMSYLNVLFRRGYQRFASEAMANGAQGLIVPDLPIDYQSDLQTALDAHGLVNVRLIAPNATPERLARLASAASGLIYAVARTGVTGVQSHFDASLASFLQRIRAHTKVKIAVGFGVRRGADIKALIGLADVAVVGTATLLAMQERGVAGVEALWQELSAAARPS